MAGDISHDTNDMTCLLLLVAKDVEVFFSGLTDRDLRRKPGLRPFTEGFGTCLDLRVQAVRVGPGVLPSECSSSLGPGCS